MVAGTLLVGALAGLCGVAHSAQTSTQQPTHTTTDAPVESAAFVPEPRIVGGNTVTTAIPWMVSLRRYTSTGYRHFCGASLIDQNYVLTAAHCVDDTSLQAKDLRVYVGGLFMSDSGSFTQRQVAAIIVHPEHTVGQVNNDLALLRLASPISNLQPVKLSTSLESAQPGETGIVYGWGSMQAVLPGQENRSPIVLPDQLQTVELTIVADSICQASYYRHNPTQALCAGGLSPPKDACQGDSGGPFLDSTGQALIGVVSAGAGCAQVGLPGLYTRLSTYTSWVSSTVGRAAPIPDTPNNTAPQQPADPVASEAETILSMPKNTFIYVCAGVVGGIVLVVVVAVAVVARGRANARRRGVSDVAFVGSNGSPPVSP
eukprot:comp19779_c0_seq1/m.23701 comp19779_c0_seq1/g.23701  ORF comp19779_c0_seq1/g.23701 comp19779_c0_seq1/m.23701 type:complete len:373 (-) comp19779_c0_seq1:423-1541(-)